MLSFFIPFSFIFWTLYLFVKKPGIGFSFSLKKNHLLQITVSSWIYLYWGQYWPEAYNHIIHLLPQILFAYLLQLHLSWQRHKFYNMDLGPIPIVLSINFFLWFPLEYFYLYYVVLAIAILSKEFIHWKKGKHIFNPSGIALGLMSYFLIISGSHHLSLGREVAHWLNRPPYMFELIFFIGAFIHFFYPILYVTLGAVLTLAMFHYIPLWFFGFTFHGVPFDVPIFLGMTLLITDPSTIPKSNMGKFLMGIGYGLTIFGSAELIKIVGAPSYFDKILFVCLLNLMVPWFETLGEKLTRTWINLNLVQQVSFYGMIFILMLPALKP